MKLYTKILSFILWFFILTLSIGSLYAAPIDTIEKWAWWESIGWINFNATNSNIDVTDTDVTGTAWSHNFGWIYLSPTTAWLTNTVWYDTEWNCIGQLSGQAWNTNLWWINFAGVSIDSDGYFGWTITNDSIGTDNAGSIYFTKPNASSSIAVKTIWRPECNMPMTPVNPIDMTDDTDTGDSDTDDITSDNTPDFTGTCEENGNSITLYVDGIANGTTTCSGGTFTVTPDTPLSDWDYDITYTDTNEFGRSFPSPVLPITVNTSLSETPDDLDMTNDTDSGNSDSDDITSDTTPDFTSTCSGTNTITLYVDGIANGTATCSDGTFTVTPDAPLPDWSYNITFTESYPWLWESVMSAILPIVVDTVDPELPVITSTTDWVISGTAEPGTFVNITTNNGWSCTATVWANGTYTCTISPEPIDGDLITISGEDLAGNTSSNITFPLANWTVPLISTWGGWSWGGGGWSSSSSSSSSWNPVVSDPEVIIPEPEPIIEVEEESIPEVETPTEEPSEEESEVAEEETEIDTTPNTDTIDTLKSKHDRDIAERVRAYEEQIKLLEELNIDVKWESLLKALPKVLPRTGTPISERVSTNPSPIVDTELPNASVFRLAGDTNTEISHWTQVLVEEDRNANKYVVVPSNGLVMPINEFAENSADFDTMINGREWNIMPALRTGALEYPGASTKGYWEVWNKVVFAHSSYFAAQEGRYKTHFQKIIELDRGEEVWVYEKQSNGTYERFAYEVNASYNTDDEDTSVLLPWEWKNLTLFTCTPIWWIDGRWIIKAKFIEDKISVTPTAIPQVSQKYKLAIWRFINRIQDIQDDSKRLETLYVVYDKLENLKTKYASNTKMMDLLEYMQYKIAKSILAQ